MNRHGSMNRVYRLLWSFALNTWVPVAELARGRGKASLRKLTVPALALSAGAALAGPEGGQVLAGTGAVVQSGATTTINQTSQNLSLSWHSFNVGTHETVIFAQPSANAIAVNRILDTNGSKILGHLNANGQVYLINPNGILFGARAQVNVGGLVASTLNIDDAALGQSTRTFNDAGSGSIVNRGHIVAARGGYVALLAHHVENQGAIAAPQGTVALAGGASTTLTFQDNTLVSMQVDRSVLNDAVQNGGLIQADGGLVAMSAGAKNSLLASVVNNTGVIEARTVENHDGRVILLGGMAAGTVDVGGTLDASAPDGGDGGFIETSAAHVKIADDVKITTAAGNGLTGSWLIDPSDFTIAASGGDITGAQLSANLGSTDITIQSTSGGSGLAGDVNVNDAVSWSSNKLTLNAQNNINIRANLSVTSSGALALEFGQGALAAGNTSNIITRGGVVNLFALATFTTKQGSDGAVKSYLVINSLGTAGSTNKKNLQGMSGGMASNYVLGADINAAATSGWNGGAGFLPIGDDTTPYTGTFNGLGHTISNLTINRPSTGRVGLFGKVGGGGSVQNVGLVGGSITGNSMVGGLVGENAYGTVSNSYATGAVKGSSYVGGLVGNNYGGAISNSYATGAVTGGSYTGGLVGNNNYGGSTISNSYATGAVSGASSTGGLAGRSNGTISNSYASGAVTSTGNSVGGLVGYNAATINKSYASGAVSGISSVGGLAGFNNGTVIASFWNTTTSGKSTSAGGIGMTTTDMQTRTNFTSATTANGNVSPAWDLANTWIVYDGHTAPLLRSFMTALTVNVNNASKTYDGQAYSGGNGATYSITPNGNLLGTLSYGGTAQNATNAGSYALTGSGLYSTQQGYLISYIDGALTVNKAELTLSGTRTYDGTTAVEGSALTATGVAGETFTVTGTGDTTNLASKNVQAGSALASSTGLALGSSANGGLSGNYNALSTTGSSVSVTKADLSLSGAREYDGSSIVAGNVLTASGVNGETFSVTGAGDTTNLASRNVQAGSTLSSLAGLALGSSGNGGLAGNYNALGASGSSVSITPANLTLGTSDVTKVYDATLAASGVATVIGGALFGSDSLSGGSFAYTDKNVGAGDKTVTTSGVTVADGNNGANYSVVYANNTTSSITAAGLLIVGVTAADKTYDATTVATLGGAAVVSALGADQVSVSGLGVGAFADASVGSGKPVTVSGFTLSGADAGNYLALQPAGLQADITAAITPPSPPSPPSPPTPPLPPSPPTTPVSPPSAAPAVVASTAAGLLASVLAPPQAASISSPNLSPTFSALDQASADEPDSSSATSAVPPDIALQIGGGGSVLRIIAGGVRLSDAAADENNQKTN